MARVRDMKKASRKWPLKKLGEEVCYRLNFILPKDVEVIPAVPRNRNETVF